MLGGGVVGLSSAIRLAEAGWRVTLWSPDPPAATTSAVAAAVWFPYEAGPRDRVLAWGDATRRELERLAREAPAGGVHVRAGLDLRRGPAPDPWWGAALPSVRRCAPGDLPPGTATASRSRRRWRTWRATSPSWPRARTR